MPFALLIAGIILTVASVRNTQGALASLLKGDFTGQNSFVWWAVSVLIIGSVGYVEQLKQLSHYFLALILIVLVLAKYKGGQNVFEEFIAALKGPIPSAPVADANAPTIGNAASAVTNALQNFLNPNRGDANTQPNPATNTIVPAFGV